VLAALFLYLVMSAGPAVAGFRVVQMMSDAAIPEHFEHSMNRPAVLRGLSRWNALPLTRWESDARTRALSEGFAKQ
jgi:hypothetical protein